MSLTSTTTSFASPLQMAAKLNLGASEPLRQVQVVLRDPRTDVWDRIPLNDRLEGVVVALREDQLEEPVPCLVDVCEVQPSDLLGSEAVDWLALLLGQAVEMFRGGGRAGA